MSKNERPDEEQKLVLRFKRNDEKAVQKLIIQTMQGFERLDLDNTVIIVRTLGAT
ncbi:hypothetical protein [Mucilaginibacter limnophilus]|uniref:hypothetical protein n=1 Tax=Mucilaginibacter limnophilus TaxID=1932778 RepID=UPI0013E2FCAF|nr:hypothetical protein [Mucilaginibacter limnophilus]